MGTGEWAGDTECPGWALDVVPFGVLVVDGKGSARYANPAWTSLTGQRPLSWAGEGWLSVLPGASREAQYNALLGAVRSGSTFVDDWVLMVPGRGERVLKVIAVPDGSSADGGVVVTATDVTADRAHIRDLVVRASHDPLTGQYNRVQFLDFVHHAVERRRRDPELVSAVVFIDIDDFKGINDRGGHHVGDEVLRTVASRIVEAVRPSDVVARYGGDEFTVLCEDLPDMAEADRIARRIACNVNRPVAAIGSCQVSIGTAVADDDTLEVNDLIRAADMAMYRAKASAPHRSSTSTR